MPKRKYDDFTEAEPREKDSKKGCAKDGPATRWYVPVTCPVCLDVFDIPQSSFAQKKPVRCKRHIEEECKGTRNAATSSDRGAPEDVVPDTSAYEEHIFNKLIEFLSNKEKMDAWIKGRAQTADVKVTNEYQKTQSEQAVPSSPKDTGVDLVTIYKLVFLPESRVVYVGRTKDLARRLTKHSSPSSGCRLVRNAFRRHGRKQFGIVPIMWCHAEDADVNESFYIIENKTLYPNGYNLRHGAAAGLEIDETTALACTSGAIVPFESDADEARAMQEAWGDVAEILKECPDDSLTEAHLRDLIRSVHPDHAGDRSFSASEVTAMFNSLHDTMRETSA